MAASARERPLFKICAYCEGLQCKNPQEKKPSGADQADGGVLRFCRDVVGCDSSVIVPTLAEAERWQKGKGIK